MGTMVSALFRESLPIWARGPVAALTKWEWLCVMGTALLRQKLGPSSNSTVKILQAGLRAIYPVSWQSNCLLHVYDV